MSRPEGYAEYPRQPIYGTAEGLYMLRDAYYGAYWLVLSTIVLGIGSEVLSAVLVAVGGASLQALSTIVLTAGLVATLAANFAIAFHFARLIARAKGKDVGHALTIAIFSTLLTPCCLGLGATAVIQQFVTSELKRYGVKIGFLGISKEAIAKAAAAYGENSGTT